jgi:hypothetical protein
MFKRITLTTAVLLCLAELTHAQTPAPTDTTSSAAVPPVEFSPANQPPTVFPNCCPAECCPPAGYWWGSADYIFGWVRGTRLPPLVTTSPAGTPQFVPGTTTPNAGVLGQDQTSVLFGNRVVDGQLRSGVRLDLGRWFDYEQNWGIDAGFFMLESENAIFFANSPTGTPILGRPFFNTTTNMQDVQLIAFPGVSTGSVTASYRNDNMLGANVTVQGNVPVCIPNFRLLALIGYRYLQFDERLAVDTNQTSTSVAPGTQLLVSDRFSTVNVFHGGEFGIRIEYFLNQLSVDASAKLAVGDVNRSIGIAGQTIRMSPGAAPTTFTGGFLALSSNSGVTGTVDTAVAPEFGVTFGWKVRQNLQLRLGYTFLYWNGVARPADLVDLHINPSLLPGPGFMPGATPSSPSFTLKPSDIWVQSLTFGAEYRF